jgi:hypothetical protein
VKAVAELERVFAPPRDAVLTKAQLALALQISLRQVDRLNLKAVTLGHRTVRFIWGQVLDELKKRAA